MTKVYSDTIPESCLGFLTPGKRYEIKWNDTDKNFGIIVDDEGEEITINSRGCSFLDGRDWTVEEEPAQAEPTDHSREYPTRIHAGHLGGGSRTWTPDPVDATEAAHSCEYVRADVVAEMLEALIEAEDYFDNRADADCDQDGFIPNAEMQLYTKINAAINAVNPVKEPKA